MCRRGEPRKRFEGEGKAGRNPFLSEKKTQRTREGGGVRGQEWEEKTPASGRGGKKSLGRKKATFCRRGGKRGGASGGEVGPRKERDALGPSKKKKTANDYFKRKGRQEGKMLTKSSPRKGKSPVFDHVPKMGGAPEKKKKGEARKGESNP